MTELTLNIDLAIDIPGASPEDIERGIAAAWQVFREAGVTAWEAASAAFHQEAIDDGGGQWREFTARDGVAAQAWREADHRAVEVCCAGWGEVPYTARLELVYDRDAYSAWARAQEVRHESDSAVLRAIGAADA
jgi:hypothetical protein